MANKRIDQLTAATSLGDSDLLAVEQSSAAKKATGTVVSNYINSKFGLSGMASDISTLQTAVAGKQDALALPLPISQGGTNATTAGNARVQLGLGTAATANVDVTLSVQGAVAEAQVTGLITDAADYNANKSLNYFGYDNNLLTWEQGGINASNGTDLVSTTVIRTVGYFDVTDIYNFDVEIPSGFRFRIYRYDDNGVFKSASSNYTGTKTSINTRSSQGTKYRFILADNSSSPRDIYTQEGSLLALRAYQNTNSLLKLASPSTQYVDTTVPLQKVVGVTKFPGNLFDPTNALNNYYIKWDTGDRNSLSGYYATGYIPVVGGTTYRANYGRSFAWYDSSYSYISGVNGNSIQNGVEAPSNAAYIRFSINKETDTSDLFDIYFTEAANFDPAVKIKGGAWCSRRIIGWMGDSIVADYDFDEIVRDALNLREYSYGTNGSTIAVNPEKPTQRSPMCQRVSSVNLACDIIAVSGGTNDFEYAWSPIGNINMRDTGEDDTYFYGAMKHLCRALIERFPDKVIFFTTPIKRMQPFTNGDGGDNTADYIATTPFSQNKYGKTLGDYADIIKEVCGLYSIPVLDMYRESLLNPHIVAQQQFFEEESTGRTGEGEAPYFYTHPNEIGKKIMARRVAAFLAQLEYWV